MPVYKPKHRGKPGYLPGLLLILCCGSVGYSQADEELTVEGHRIRSERARISTSGRSLLIQPEHASRFDVGDQLRRESSLTFVESGRISPSGFMIPRVRGQDSKLTDIYIEDILLSDPYSGLPLVEDLDLRAFGSLELHQGSSSIDVPGSNSVGVLRYRFKPSQTSKSSLGLVTGAPYGHSLWTASVYKDKNREFRLYGRIHQSSGRYSYYSDEATPYNARDDKEKTRLNNDQRSEQIMPYYRQDIGEYTLKALAWSHRAGRGIPSGSTVLTSNARDLTRGLLGDLSLSRPWSDVGPFNSAEVTVHLGRTEDTRETIDPERLVLNSSRQSKMKVISNRQGLRSRLETDRFRAFLTVEEAQSEIDQSFNGMAGTGLDRSNENAVLGLGYYPARSLAFETKVSSHRQWDKVSHNTGIVLAEEKDGGSGYRFARSESLSAAVGEDIGLYAQISRSRRLPSLYEEFGNGNTVRPNSELKAENLFHREAGIFLQAGPWCLSSAYYQDDTDEKIIIVPIMASASKALNVGETKISGLDAELAWQNEGSLLTAKTSWIKAEDHTRREVKTLPSIPARVHIGEWRQSWTPSFTSFLSGRYRSRVYRDLGNSVVLPSLTTYDLNLDLSWRGFEWGLAVRNLLNTKDLAISSGQNQGRTGISDIAGSPLPGRQWIFHFITHLE